MPENRSLAVWCIAKAENGPQPVNLEAHFNYWRISGDEDFRRSAKNKARDFMEIGILLDNPNDVDKINIFLPHTADRKDINDCSHHFQTAAIAQGIFNEVLSATQSGVSRFVDLSTPVGNFCRVHQFINKNGIIDASELQISPLADGVLLNITRRAMNEACRNGSGGVRIYFRLRIYIYGVHQARYVNRVPVPDRIFQSGSEEVEYIDFRLNEARTLPQQVEAEMRNDDYDNMTCIKLVAFLTAIPVQSQLASSSAPSHKLRLLEHDLWSNYVPSGLPNGMVVHHWKKTNGRIADFSAFVKMQTRKTGRFTLIKYLSVAFLFGILGNLAAAGIQSGFEKLFMSHPTAAVESPKPASDLGKPTTSIPPPQNPVKGGR